MLKHVQKLDVSFAVGILGRYQSDPRLDHWKATKESFKILTKDTKSHAYVWEI